MFQHKMSECKNLNTQKNEEKLFFNNFFVILYLFLFVSNKHFDTYCIRVWALKVIMKFNAVVMKYVKVLLENA